MSATPNHAKETTGFSLSETVVDRGSQPPRPTAQSRFIQETPSITTDSLFVDHKPHPTREETIDPRFNYATIPPEHAHRTLVLCFDGTGDQFDADNSNIVQLVSLLKKNDRSKQMVYYQAGIGTYTSPKVMTPMLSTISKTLDQMFAWNLDAHVMSGYEFLMQNYVHGDKICIFGFSRGAYTARSLAGMLHKVGLLPADNFTQVPFAYRMYTNVDSVGWEQSNAFKAAFSIDVKIEFLGVWDTVDSVGLIPKRLPFTTSNTIVRTFRHALALDERRAKFKANLWNRPTKEEEKLGIEATQNHVLSPGSAGIRSSLLKRESEEDAELSSFEKQYESEGHEHTTDILEVWFSGCHCDVGGGSVDNKTRHSLARIPLRWMVRECFKTNSGLMFDSASLRKIGIDPTSLYPFVTPRPAPLPLGDARLEVAKRPSIIKNVASKLAKLGRKSKPADNAKPQPIIMGTEEEEELRDALSPAYDQLKLARWWWVLELIPLNLRYQRGDDIWISYIGINMAAPRHIPRQHVQGINLHRSVQLRMEAQYINGKKKKDYKPKPELRVPPTFVD